MKSGIQIEVCCGSVQSALNAQEGGAHRIELCQNLEAGGITPSAGDIMLARKKLSIKLQVLIRPRDGDFLYSTNELEVIREDIRYCKSAGVDGIVVGFLTQDGNIDLKLTEEIIVLARPMSVTFHRAFDLCRDPETALDQLIDMGVDRLLTSGQQPTALEGASLINKLVQQAGDFLKIMPGSGIREHNIKTLIEQTHANEYHVSARKIINSPMTYQPIDIPMGKFNHNFQHQEIDTTMIAQLMQQISQ